MNIDYLLDLSKDPKNGIGWRCPQGLWDIVGRDIIAHTENLFYGPLAAPKRTDGLCRRIGLCTNIALRNITKEVRCEYLKRTKHRV